ncbi:MAG: transcription-repair coupling factor, partial [Desulfobacterales bacterium]|nr:transcription-repair coupling factor [Desulfobacterales bacterium]
QPMLVLVHSVKEAERFARDLNFFSNGRKLPVMIFPQYNSSPVKSVFYQNEIASTRINTLYKIAGSEAPPVIITTPGALLRKLIPKQELLGFAELVMEGEEINRDFLIEKLVSGGYTRSLIVEEPGDYCVRGGILDVFTPFYPDPLRIELSGDIVESIRFFSASNQRTLKSVPEAIIIPAKEAIFKNEDLNTIIGRIREQAAALEMPVTMARELIDKIKREGVLPGIENLIPLIYSKPGSFFDYLPGKTLFVRNEPEELKKAALEIQEQESINYLSARDRRRLCVEPESAYLSWEEATESIDIKKHLNFKAIEVYCGDEKRNCLVNCHNFIKNNDQVIQTLRNSVEQENHLTPLAEWINEKISLRCAVMLVCSTRSQSERIKSLFLPYGIQMETKEGFSEIHNIRG